MSRRCASFCELDRDQAEEADFAVFNRGRHICLELPQDWSTISVKTPDGKKLTFAFVPRPNGQGHQSVDVVHHGDVKNDSGNPLQHALFLGQGPTNARTHPNDESPTTVVTVIIPE